MITGLESGISDELRALAVRILRAAATPETTDRDLGETAAALGIEDPDAALLANVAWCAVAPYSELSALDPRRDATAADKLEQGWTPDWECLASVPD